MPIGNSWGNRLHARVNKPFAVANSTNKTRVRTHSNLHKIINQRNNSNSSCYSSCSTLYNSNSTWSSCCSISYCFSSGWGRFNSFSDNPSSFWHSHCSTLHRQISNCDRLCTIWNSSNYYGYKPNPILNSYNSKWDSTNNTCHSFNSILHSASSCFRGYMPWFYFNNDLTDRSCLDFYKTYNCINRNTSRAFIGIPLCFNKYSAFNQIFPSN
jgi:hypothetical protein